MVFCSLAAPGYNSLTLHESCMNILLKGIIQPKIWISWKCTHPQAIQDELVSSSEEIWRNVLHHLLTNGSSAVNGCRQNESSNSW